ncbi:uncharacterized protein MONBRDRAFT_6969 [Monosiga brevicollis MX1]|uniref:DHHA2 domain-containing protein n=1 Tax=Monosiga brevicollis TaxID=81824 RepID=A9UVH8_MONBE|nr:uncharacterized protein MONBRDRAFT_6969 [Monosiga brevicollis MX1]EDQ90582.1 predicted protein [Monosiga brevicollis MX1]|eukprot:XP_001744633.1 hypothetical protein [Monosiga brevicollis MX1]
MALLGYVRAARQRLTALLAGPTANTVVHVVMGNEASDLDSVVSTFVRAWQLQQDLSADQTDPARSMVVLPLINTTREDLPLRAEVMHVLGRHNLSPDELCYIDELPLQSWADANALCLHLVDHNRLAKHQQQWAPFVCSVMDHHDVGPSTLQLLGRRPFTRCQHDDAVAADATACEMLLSAILIDTVKLDASKGRCLPLDQAVAGALNEVLDWDLNAEFDRLQQAKADVSHLTVNQLLRKDYKQIDVGRIRIGLPAVNLALSAFFSRPLPDVTEHLQLLRVAGYKQNNTKLSRKYVLPAVQRLAEAAQTSPSTKVQILGLMGRAGSGKSTVAKYLADEMNRLTALLYPALSREILAAVQRLEAADDSVARVLVVEGAALVDAGWHTVCNHVLLVTADDDVVHARLATRGWSEAEIERRLAMQHEHADRATIIIDNNGTDVATLKATVRDKLNNAGLATAK